MARVLVHAIKAIWLKYRLFFKLPAKLEFLINRKG